MAPPSPKKGAYSTNPNTVKVNNRKKNLLSTNPHRLEVEAAAKALQTQINRKLDKLRKAPEWQNASNEERYTQEYELTKEIEEGYATRKKHPDTLADAYGIDRINRKWGLAKYNAVVSMQDVWEDDDSDEITAEKLVREDESIDAARTRGPINSYIASLIAIASRISSDAPDEEWKKEIVWAIEQAADYATPIPVLSDRVNEVLGNAQYTNLLDGFVQLGRAGKMLMENKKDRHKELQEKSIKKFLRVIARLALKEFQGHWRKCLVRLGYKLFRIR
ncbi:hypothetical protein OQA88_2403, partial [Cercophora sp. LCS_1]